MEKILLNHCHEIIVKILKSIFKMIELAKGRYSEILNENRCNLCQMKIATLGSVSLKNSMRNKRLKQTLKIYSLYYLSYAESVSDEIKRKINKHLEFVKSCDKYWINTSKNFLRITVFERHVMTNKFKDSYKEIEKINYFFDKSKYGLEDFIYSFEEKHIEDENGSIGNVLQSLRQLLLTVFD